MLDGALAEIAELVCLSPFSRNKMGKSGEPRLKVAFMRFIADHISRSTLDGLEKIGLMAPLLYSLYNSFRAPHESIFSLQTVLTLEAVLMAIFIALRPRTNIISIKPADWIVSVFVTYMPTLVTLRQELSPIMPLGFLLALAFSGMAIELLGKLSLRRSFGVVPANRGVVASGMYGYVRHPIYLGYCITYTAIFLGAPCVWNAFLILFLFLGLGYRIKIEEDLLKEDPEYRALMAKTRYRLLPGVY